MTIHNLDKIFHPNNIAVVGASTKPASVGRTVLENLQRAGFPGDIYPVNPNYSSILDLPAFRGIDQLPTAPDLAIIATPAVSVPSIVRQCGEFGIEGLIILSAGFREVGSAGQALEKELAEEVAKFPGIRVIGPNCLGVLVPEGRLNASFAADMPQAGHMAFISQSGALCTSILDWSLGENVGFSNFVSIGNALNVKISDLIDYFDEDPRTTSIVLYVESVSDSRQFMSAARAFTGSKPIVVYKAGRFAQSAQAAASHTGAMAGVDAVYEAAFQRAGMVRVYRAEDMFDCAELLAHHRTPQGPRLAIISNAGGPGVMATDELLECNGELAELGPDTLEKMESMLPPHWSHGNPVDLLGDAGPDRFAKALEAVLGDRGVDAVLVILTPQAMTDSMGTAQVVAAATARTPKPILAAWMGGPTVAVGRNILAHAGVAAYDSPDRAVRAFMYLVSYRRNREILYETPRPVPLEIPLDRSFVQAQLDRLASNRQQALSEVDSKAILAAYGVPTAVPRLARTSLEAVELANWVGYPVVMKVHSPQIVHKTEVQGVITGISSDVEVRRAFQDIVTRARQKRPDAEIEGVTVQPMLSSPNGLELIVGAKRDPVFGAVMMVGAGGIMAELLRDRALELPPLNERLALRMLQSLRIRPLLEGFRGRRAVDMDRLIEVLMRLSYLIADNPGIAELDVNPLLVTPEGTKALDARIILDPKSVWKALRPFSHLAIRPYPEEYVRHTQLHDGTDVLLRPIQPEDEPMWHHLLADCSEHSLWLRFRYLFKETTHEMATRFCFIDYDRTMAIVAEVGEGENRRLIGVGRLVADADHRKAEYAVLVADAWQGKGLGTLLTDFCLEICETWGIEFVYAETSAENHRMQQILFKRAFDRHSSSLHDFLFERHLKHDGINGRSPQNARGLSQTAGNP